NTTGWTASGCDKPSPPGSGGEWLRFPARSGKRLANRRDCHYSGAARRRSRLLPVSSVSSRSTRKPKGEGHARRGEILAAAERIFVEHGYVGATIRKIADEVGLSSTALYLHFSDKGEILLEICRDALAALIAQTTDLSELDAPPEDRLRRMIDAYVEF